MAWNYQREETQDFRPIPEGAHRIRVKSAEFKKSSAGNNMIEIQFAVSGYNSTLYHYITFMKDNPQITNRMLTAFYDAFKDIPEGSNKLGDWIGKTGACQVKHETYNGKTQAKLYYFIKADKQGNLPSWKEPAGTSNTNASTSAGIPEGFEEVSDDDLPF